MPFERRSIEVIRGQIDENVCRDCGYVGLMNRPIEAYDHPNGWAVEGYPQPQWLYVVCPDCEYQWALWKLMPLKKESKEISHEQSVSRTV